MKANVVPTWLQEFEKEAGYKMKWWKRILHNEGRPPPMTPLDIWRAVLHLPVGCFAVCFIMFMPVAGTVFALGFLTYEVVEDWRIKDRGYKDIFGYLIGMALMGIILYLTGG